MKIVYAAAECTPFFKTGGLGDVMGALPKEIAKKGEEVAVILPFYEKIMAPKFKTELQDEFNFIVEVGWREQYCGVKSLKKDGLTYYFIDNQYYFGRDGIYGYFDDGERFAFFQMAVIEVLERIEFIPDVLHVNDYHTAMIPFLLKEKYRWINAYADIKTVLSIHNLQFQGIYAPQILADLFGMGLEKYYDGTIRFNDCVNFMKAGLIYANQIVTVSPTYAEEIKTPEFGEHLEAILNQESWHLTGILNGIDYDVFDPATDPHIYQNFDSKKPAGKAENKAQLQKELGLPVEKDVLLIGAVSRLTHQKGFQLLVNEMNNLLQFDVQVVVLGTGEYAFEEAFRYFNGAYSKKHRGIIDFDLDLAQKIYAGVDLFLMPSAFEPCGLSQMISMRYGTLPLVHEIGGLKDTVIPYNPLTKTGTGFGFVDFDSYIFMETIKKALKVFMEEPKIWQKMMAQGMTTDFSWTTRSNEYQDVYQKMF
ncbi:glycogen synthase GlgA [Enterococcus sp. HY326]|uniref:glycogen synthase GlgA n=1 Tax=Enterococcus sp. HY326 TaxID=2971265 RepID=UPI002240BC58|nr:glycogen synthase GlgA [Enterococcus sp. HY326]